MHDDPSINSQLCIYSLALHILKPFRLESSCWKLPNWRWAEGISGEAVKCVEMGMNSNSESIGTTRNSLLPTTYSVDKLRKSVDKTNFLTKSRLI